MKTNIYSNDPQSSQNAEMRSTQLMSLFGDELRDIFWAEKAVTKSLPLMVENATSKELRDSLQNHLEETKNQVNRLMQIFDMTGINGSAKKCEAMEGLIREAEDIMQNCEAGSMRDAGIISAAQKIEHYEIASYGTLRQFAETLEMEDVADLLDQTLEEEKAADEELSEIATTTINMEAANTRNIDIN
jgi:ferritin-like metal-binding protein YciE